MTILYYESQEMISAETRRILAARRDMQSLLGLPHDHRLDNGMPFNEIPA